jgi:D-glycero-D-manno-heptose 1,7-bisphosphate phosphatase
MPRAGLILLDRDGVLNRMLVDPEHGTVDSPMHPDQVQILPGVPEALARLTAAGYGIAIVTNQPAAAKGKTTRTNLEAVHRRVLESVQAAGGRVASSHICYHRGEDQCACRKPKPGLIEEAFRENPGFDKAQSWMVGDGIIDIQAGQQAGVQTAMLAPHKADTLQLLKERGVTPAIWADDLPAFVDRLLKG